MIPCYWDKQMLDSLKRKVLPNKSWGCESG